MSARGLYESLFEDPGLLGRIAREGAARREAAELARAEYEEGWYVDERQLPMRTERLAAADDAEEELRYAGHGVELLLRIRPAPATLTQIAGPAGISLQVDGSNLPLSPGQPSPVPLDRAPDALIVLDARGRRRRLPRQ